MPIHNLKKFKRIKTATFSIFAESNTTGGFDHRNPTNKRFQMSQRAALGSSARGGSAAPSIRPPLFEKRVRVPAAKRETSRGAASRPRVLRSSRRPATAPQPANMLPRMWLGTGMIAMSMSKMIPIQTGNDRPRWSEHFRERCNGIIQLRKSSAFTSGPDS
jgi:hypothetical protein